MAVGERVSLWISDPGRERTWKVKGKKGRAGGEEAKQFGV